MITHDLKGPTTSIMMGSELALNGIKKVTRQKPNKDDSSERPQNKICSIID